MERDELFERAIVSQDDAYLRSEEALRESGDEAVFRRNVSHADPVGRLIAEVMLEWSEAGDDPFRRALEYLDEVERVFAGTAALTPPVHGVVENLTELYGNRLAGLLALRLAKTPTLPGWRILVTLAYLERNPTPDVTDALIRFATATPEPEAQQAAARTIKALNDPDVARKLAVERERLAKTGGALPPALSAFVA